MTSVAPTLSDYRALRSTGTPSFFALPPAVELLRDRVREFAETQLRPAAERADDGRGGFDQRVLDAGHDIGLLRMIVPEEYGGLGHGILGTAVVMEELAAVCANSALVFGANVLAQAAVLLSGNPLLQSRYLTTFADEEPALACNVVTEETTGTTEVVLQGRFALVDDGLVARRDGDHYIINGHKRHVTNGRLASWACVYANLVGRSGSVGLTAFIVPLDAEGVTRSDTPDGPGHGPCLEAHLDFTEVRVPAENVVAGEGNGEHLSALQSNLIRASVAAISTGVARGAFEIAHRWSAHRRLGGLPLFRHQSGARKLAEMSSKIEAARLLYLQAAHQVDNLLPTPSYGPAVAKLFADRIAIEVAEEAMSVLGSRAYARECGLERYVRDAFGTLTHEGTPETLAQEIADALYPGGRPYSLDPPAVPVATDAPRPVVRRLGPSESGGW
ncbi:acyl-CoA dehydrogenase family protein [Allostreptomyces psammosilenae]|uniref:Alkylation response protein AidB-like acyl-CoA dehydrogenase n=1 Tax=Allostreptomyces psammosilenae TaxID=1892865 RepID=A0A852ZSB6_9ACTN|nr:acyl-CoA dehydrogenase family protein [Allostreptomyces psammosilenae]NYI05283.1 alkylation response protein AidB-like acyl-CoA dehydrogenase [Allostreptomyces psammosilenae]